MQIFLMVLTASGVFAGVACFIAYGVRKMEMIDAENTSGALPIGGNRIMAMPYGVGGFGGGGSSCGDGGGSCS